MTPSESVNKAPGAPQANNAGMEKSHAVSRSFIFIGILICLYLTWPAFNAVHLEGFTAQTESIALLMSRAPGIEHDPYLPLVSQFIYQTRSAVIDGMALIYELFPNAGDRAFQGVVLASYCLLLAASVLFARRWGGMSPVFPFFALILTQGIAETSFFFNDNIVSAALACAGLALISQKSAKTAWMACGIFMALAILSRLDAVLMVPVVMGIVFYSYKDNYKRFVACSVIVLTTGALLIASAIYHGFSLLDVLFVAGKFVNQVIDEPTHDKYRLVWIRILFIGLSSLPLLLIGIWINWQKLKSQHSYIGLVTFIVYPVLLAIFAPKATEVRYIFPLLSPLIALHVGTGMQWVYQQIHDKYSGKKYWYAVAATGFALVVAAMPPALVKMYDGPRGIFGRLWSPVSWAHWQASVHQSSGRSKNLVAALDDRRTNILVSTHYNDEFYMRLRLIEAGFIPQATHHIFQGCDGFSVLKKGNSTVAHIRTEPQYSIAPVSARYNAAMQISAASRCAEIQSFGKAYVTTFGEEMRGMPPEIYGILPSSFDAPLSAEFYDLRSTLEPNNKALARKYGLLNYRPLTDQEFSAMLVNSQKYLSSHPEYDRKTGAPVTIEDYGTYYRAVQGPTKLLLNEIRQGITGISGRAPALINEQP